MHDGDDFYRRAIRTKLGDALRAQYDLSEPLPEQLTKTLLKLDQPKGLDLDDPEQRRRFMEDSARAQGLDVQPGEPPRGLALRRD